MTPIRLIVLALPVLLTACSVSSPRIHLAASQRTAPEPVANSPAWPERLSATTPRIESKEGNAPVALGTYGHCTVHGISPGAENPLLMFASRTSRPVQSGDKEFDIDLTVDGENKSRVVTRHHRITIAELEAARAEPVRGLVLYLGSIMGIAPREQRLLASLRRDGWNIAACLPPFDLLARERILAIEGPGDLEAAAGRFAHNIDQHLAERAYVAESLLAYVRAERPEWLEGKLVVVGSSAGALALPAVISRIGPERVDAAVLIGGGANVARIMLRSSLELVRPLLFDGPVEDPAEVEEEGTPLSDDQLAALERSAFAKSRLDPALLASRLDAIPTLLLLGSRDAIVPVETGSLLYEKLGRPELWSYPVGHNLLFFGLPGQSKRIASWLAGATRDTTEPAPIAYERRPRVRVRIKNNQAEEGPDFGRPVQVRSRR